MNVILSLFKVKLCFTSGPRYGTIYGTICGLSNLEIIEFFVSKEEQSNVFDNKVVKPKWAISANIGLL